MIISKTPLRASLFGGGTDFETYYTKSKFGYGSVISATLDTHVYITVNKKSDGRIRIVYNGNELVDKVEDVKHNIIREALKLVGIENSIEIIYMADVPLSSEGIGLASSSALTVGVLNALHAYKHEFVTNEQLAKEACYIEIECLGQKIGIQDQYAVAIGGFNRYRFLSNGKVEVTPLVIKNDIKNKMINNLFMFYTGNTRDSRKILSEQSNNIESKRLMLDELVNTVNYVYGELVKGNIDIIGSELDKTWNIKKSLSSGISNDNIEKMYDIAKANGALGGKILGAGGGGFMLLYAKEENHEKLKKGMSGYEELNFDVDYQGTRIVFAD